MEYVKSYDEFVNEGFISDSFKTILNNIIKSIGSNLFFVSTFGVTVEALWKLFISIVTQNQLIPLTKTELFLLFICGMAFLLKESKPTINKLVEKIKEKNISKYFKNVVIFLKTTLKIIKESFKLLGKSISGITNLLGYTALLLPVILILKEYLSTNGVDINNYPGLLTSVAIGVGAITFSTTINYIVKTVKDRKES